jgi:hypothetical protein
MRTVKETKLQIIAAGEVAIDQLIKVAKEDILMPQGDDDDRLSADKLKNAAATKKMAIFDAFEILSRIENERESLKEESTVVSKQPEKQGGFAERRSR